MPIETATHLHQLNTANPTSSDPIHEGDNHIRLLKAVLKATFPNINAAVNPTPAEMNHLVGVTSGVQTQINTANSNAAQRASNLSDLANVATARTNLDVAQRQSSVTDTTAGRGIINGGHGIGASGDLTGTVADLNTATTGGVMGVAASATNLPLTTSVASSVLSIKDFGSRLSQLWAAPGAVTHRNRLWFRQRIDASTWTTPVEIVTSAGGQSFSGGFTATAFAQTITANYQPSPINGNLQSITNGANAKSFLAPNVAGDYTLQVLLTNASGAGAITFSGFTFVEGDDLTLTAGHRFLLFITKIGTAVYMTVRALQ
jgi:hypothetical protein